MSDLVERLLGVYRGQHLSGTSAYQVSTPDNENYFVQKFPTTPTQVEAAREIERLQAENEFLREALRPFAFDVSDEVSMGKRTDFVVSEDVLEVLLKLKPKHFRRARAAYEGKIK